MALVAIGSALKAFAPAMNELSTIGELLIGLGAALGGIGIAHKIEKSK